jgi:hypothetical protein
VGKIVVAYPRDGAGRLYLALWDWTNPSNYSVQNGSSGGYGHDKVSAALQGLTFAGTILTDHPNNWEKVISSMGYEIWHLV